VGAVVRDVVLNRTHWYPPGIAAVTILYTLSPHGLACHRRRMKCYRWLTGVVTGYPLLLRARLKSGAETVEDLQLSS
jgi:hypothetical protein